MQTFLAYEDFDASVAVLDSMRLGKQRLECLQALRALVLPVYGWSNHPVVRMWRGYLPALTRYTLAAIDEWTLRGNRDTVRPLALEFAPDVDGVAQNSLTLPSWLGTARLHDSHRSNLVRKVPELYRPLFTDVPDDLPYFWPEAEAPEGADVISPAASDGWVLRARTAAERDEWVATGVVTFPEVSPTGKRTKAWIAQSDAFGALRPGTRVAVTHGDAPVLASAIITGEPHRYQTEDGNGLRLSVDVEGELARAAFPHPVLLQDPRTLFQTALP